PSRARLVPESSLGTLAAATALAAFVSGFQRGSVGGGIGLALTPMLTLPAQSALGLSGLVLLLADPISVLLEHRLSHVADGVAPAACHAASLARGLARLAAQRIRSAPLVRPGAHRDRNRGVDSAAARLARASNSSRPRGTERSQTSSRSSPIVTWPLN